MKQSKKDCWTIQWTRLALEHRDKEEENDMFDSYDRIELADNVEDDVDRSSEVDEADDFEEMGNAKTKDVDKVVSLANPKDEIAD